MGWESCGTDKFGRKICYGVQAKCDDPECSTQIDRGLSYVCGNMHGGGDHGCGKYFCNEHLFYYPGYNDLGIYHQLCEKCWTKIVQANQPKQGE